MIEVVNGQHYRCEVKRGVKLLHLLGCDARFRKVGYYKNGSLTTHYYRCECCERQVYEKRKRGSNGRQHGVGAEVRRGTRQTEANNRTDHGVLGSIRAAIMRVTLRL